MRSVRAASEDRRVPDAPAHRVVLDLDGGPGPIAGSVRDVDGVPRRFVGWLELCALLEAARGTAGNPPAR